MSVPGATSETWWPQVEYAATRLKEAQSRAVVKLARVVDGYARRFQVQEKLTAQIHKTALGATDTVEWEYVENIGELLRKLASENIAIYAIEQVENAIMLQHFEPQNKRSALVFGNEVFGVSQKAIELCDGCIEIPQLGTKHSLNISVSAGIVIWDLFSKLNYTK